jgi:hypothetical protein
MTREKLLAKIEVALVEDDTNQYFHGDGHDLTHKEMATIALRVIDELGLIKYEDDNLSGPTWKRQKHNSYEPL